MPHSIPAYTWPPDETMVPASERDIFGVLKYDPDVFLGLFGVSVPADLTRLALPWLSME